MTRKQRQHKKRQRFESNAIDKYFKLQRYKRLIWGLAIRSTEVLASWGIK